ncbi:MAG: hypothetical protein ILP17_10460 [Lachnospiraceae bacterium]|nr:hypothetical protein [Lachnospiraceae bacterium]
MVLSVLALTALGILLWMKVIRVHKARLTDGLPKTEAVGNKGKGVYLDDVTVPDASVFIAYMYPSNATGEVFSNNLGLDTYTAPEMYTSVRMFREYISKALSMDKRSFPERVMLGISPYSIFRQSCSSRDLYLKNLEFLYDLADDHPGIPFYIMLPDDSAEMWNSLSPDELKDARLSYITFVRNASEHPNLLIYYHASEEWVLYSDCIRTGGYDTPLTEEVNDNLLIHEISDGELTYLLLPDLVNTVMDSVIELSGDYKNTRSEYADLQDKEIYFLGDSIFGNYRDGTAVSSFFGDMTGSRTYNLGQGGVSCTSLTDSSAPMGIAFDHLTGIQNSEEFNEAFSYYYSYGAFRLASSKLSGTDGEGSIFIIEYGLNDYFSGRQVSEYKQAITDIVNRLKTSYPKARILLLSPGYIDIYSLGEEILSENGSPLQAYRDAVSETASELGCEIISQTDDMGFTQDETYLYLLPDGVHYNEKGRYLLAQELARYFK